MRRLVVQVLLHGTQVVECHLIHLDLPLPLFHQQRPHLIQSFLDVLRHYSTTWKLGLLRTRKKLARIGSLSISILAYSAV